jgi:probable rRNA maturation factor
MKRVPFRLQIRARVGSRHVPFLRSRLRRARQMINAPLRELSLALVNDAQISQLHHTYMNLAGPTDVLTFPLDQDARGRALSGEVVVCVPEARRRARELGTRVEHELLLYALHGMLHLAGFDDRTARAFARMHRMEDSLLSRLGVGPVFRPPANPPSDRPRSRSRSRSRQQPRTRAASGRTRRT